jgi:hypothetical protein
LPDEQCPRSGSQDEEQTQNQLAFPREWIRVSGSHEGLLSRYFLATLLTDR